MIPQKVPCLKLGEILGSGAFSHVFSAKDTTSGAVFAVKKSRASLKLKRPLLAYEARILKLLQGHQAIPKVIGYKRVEHFEYLALEKLGYGLNDEQHQLSVKDIASIAHQMLSALKHIHSHNIVHRDIKPGNILAYRDHDVSRICLVDFGLARPYIAGPPKLTDLAKQRINVTGTLAYASLNAYEGYDLNPHDDVQSLAYLLLSLLRGTLPWHGLCSAGTAVGRLLQIRRKMEAWSGARLSKGYPAEFGELLDYSRAIKFNEDIAYDRFVTSFRSLEENTTSTDLVGLKAPQSTGNNTAKCPVEKGQLVLLQLDVSGSVEGYTVRQENTSYQHDPSFSRDDWSVPARPAIILSTEVDNASRQLVKVIPLSIDVGSELVEHISLTEIGLDDPALGILDCYAFPRTVKFYCSPQQAPVPSYWKVSSEDLNKLSSQFERRIAIYDWDETKHVNSDIRYDARIRFQDPKFYANIAPLDPSTLNASHYQGIPIQWTGQRGWFDECVKAARRRGWEEGADWTGLPQHIDENEGQDNSYCGFDASFWEFNQEERDVEQSLLNEENIEIPEILEIVE